MTIKDIRARTGLSQAAFAQKYGIPLNTIHNWEQGVRKPPAYVVALLDRVVSEDAKHEQ